MTPSNQSKPVVAVDSALAPSARSLVFDTEPRPPLTVLVRGLRASTWMVMLVDVFVHVTTCGRPLARSTPSVMNARTLVPFARTDFTTHRAIALPLTFFTSNL